MSVHDGILKRAIKVAEGSQYYPFQIGALVFKGSRIFAEGKNKVGSSSRIKDRDKFVKCSVHAEADVLSKLSNDKTKGASLIIIRLNSGTKKMSNGKPCEFCQRMIYEKGIKKVYVSNSDGKLTEYKVVEPKGKLVVDYEKKEHSYSDKFIRRIR